MSLVKHGTREQKSLVSPITLEQNKEQSNVMIVQLEKALGDRASP